jgi:hypothetical protein
MPPKGKKEKAPVPDVGEEVAAAVSPACAGKRRKTGTGAVVTETAPAGTQDVAAAAAAALKCDACGDESWPQLVPQQTISVDTDGSCKFWVSDIRPPSGKRW